VGSQSQAAPQQQPATPPQQENQEKPKVAVEVRVVNVLTTVRDKHDTVVFTLGKDDFVLEQDGHEQAITYFSKESNLPLTLGLLVDTSLSQRSVLGEERTASYAFLDHLLRADSDRAFLIHFDREVELLQDLTNSRDKLDHGLALLSTPEWSSSDSGSRGSGGGGGGGGRGSGRGRGGAGTLLYDAVYLASTDMLKKQSGRKAVVVLSDGVDRGSKETLKGAIEAAQRADTMVYSILFQAEQNYAGRPYGGRGGMGGPGRRYPQEERPDGKKILKQISAETGGRLFEVTKKQTIDQIYAEIGLELRSQYNLGYTPAGADAALGYHKLAVKTKPKDMTVQARAGYYAEP